MFQHLCRSLFFLVAFSIFEVWHPLCGCDASTVTAGRSPIDWNQRRKDLEERLRSGVRTASDAITGKKIRDGFAEDEIAEEPIGLSGYRSDYADGNNTVVPQEELVHGFGQSFVFQRFQSPAVIRKALESVRSVSSFKWFEGKDGRKGYVSSTKLGGDCVLAESEQIAIDCTTEDVLRVYLSGELQTSWNSKNCISNHFVKFKKDKNHPSELSNARERPRTQRRLNMWSTQPNDDIDEGEENQYFRDDKDTVDRKGGYFYLQDLVLKSQRVISGQTGPMRYQQTIEIDKVGQDNYAILVRLLKNKNDIKRANNHSLGQDDPTSTMTTTIKKPFESLQVYVGLEQMGSDVKIYAAGVFEVNRKVVPKLLVFDASGFAGSIAGKGTLWLAGYFEKASMKRRSQNREER